MVRTVSRPPIKPSVRSVWDADETDRRTMIVASLELILGKQPSETLVDSIWALASGEAFAKLTEERGWTVDRYEQWLVQTTGALLRVSGD